MNGDFWGNVMMAIFALKAIAALFIFAVIYLVIDLPPWGKWFKEALGIKRLRRG